MADEGQERWGEGCGVGGEPADDELEGLSELDGVGGAGAGAGYDGAGLTLVLLGGAGLGEAVGVGAGLDDVAAEGEAVDDGGAEAWVGEGFGPAAEAVVAGDRDGVLFFAFGEDLEEEFGAAPV